MLAFKGVPVWLEGRVVEVILNFKKELFSFCNALFHFAHLSGHVVSKKTQKINSKEFDLKLQVLILLTPSLKLANLAVKSDHMIKFFAFPASTLEDRDEDF